MPNPGPQNTSYLCGAVPLASVGVCGVGRQVEGQKLLSGLCKGESEKELALMGWPGHLVAWTPGLESGVAA